MSKVHKDGKGRVILDEEKFIECLDHIIERDFFPDLQELRKEHSCLPAKPDESAHVDLSNETFDTPLLSGGGELATPRAEDGKQHVTLSAPIKADTSLDKFLHHHISEDNASYKELVLEEGIKQQETANTLYAPSIEYKPKLEAIGYHEKHEGKEEPETWSFKRKNPLIFQPESLPIRDRDNPNANRGINHSNTRLPTTISTDGIPKKVLSSILQDKVGIDGKPLNEDTPNVRGYAYCATPQIEPGVDASPLMTWGEVESTPIRVESTPSRQNFKIPQVPEKDRLGHELAERVNKKHRQRHTKAMSAMRKLASTTGITPQKLSSLSPAARKLAMATGSIRSSKRSIFSVTPSRSTTPSRTPSWDSPAPSSSSWTPKPG